MKKRWILIALGIALVVGLGAGIWLYVSKQTPDTMKEEEFVKLKDKEMEVVDASVLYDEDLEKWYLENRPEKGEHIYQKDGNTYILLSIGSVENENTFLLINGVKENNGQLIVSYEALVMDNAPNIPFEDSIRSALIKVQGKYDKVKSVEIQRENQMEHQTEQES